MSKQEIQNQISEISNDLYQNDCGMGAKELASKKRKLNKLMISLYVLINQK